MEALTAVAVAGLTVIDMIKSTDRWATLEGVGMIAKQGGRSGSVERPPEREL
jgi:cyclic pyranopterin phosphate synthase